VAKRQKLLKVIHNLTLRHFHNGVYNTIHIASFKNIVHFSAAARYISAARYNFAAAHYISIVTIQVHAI
jgi:hypothetical protein